MNKSNFTVKRMSTLALLIAVILVMSFTPLGYLQIGPLSMSLLTIPVAIGAITMGPVDGMILGIVFGLTSLFNAMSGSSAMGTAMFTINPFGCFVVCVVARALMGLCGGLVYQGLSKANSQRVKVNYAISGLMSAFFNTLFFMGSLCIFFYGSDYVQNLVSVLHVSNPIMFIIVLVGFQGVLEMVLCSIVSTAVSIPLSKITN